MSTDDILALLNRAATARLVSHVTVLLLGELSCDDSDILKGIIHVA